MKKFTFLLTTLLFLLISCDNNFFLEKIEEEFNVYFSKADNPQLQADLQGIKVASDEQSAEDANEGKPAVRTVHFGFRAPEGTDLSNLKPTIDAGKFWKCDEAAVATNFSQGRGKTFSYYKKANPANTVKVAISVIEDIRTTSDDSQVSKGNKFFMEKGFFISSWISSPGWNSAGAEYNEGKMKELGFSGPLFYNREDEYPDPSSSFDIYSIAFGFSSHPWEPEYKILSDWEKNFTKKPAIIYAGDEVYFTEEAMRWAGYTFSQIKKEYPDSICHNNQWGAQYSFDQMRFYRDFAKPDMITYDAYYFNEKLKYPGGSCYRMYDHLSEVKIIADEPEKPLPIGHYVQAFRTSDGVNVGTQIATESELNAYYYCGLTYGAKWFTLFRWLQNDDKVGVLFNSDGTTTQTFDIIKAITTELRNLEPHMKLLHCKEVFYKSGSIFNIKPKFLKKWTSSTDSFIKKIETENLGTTNEGRPGDILISYFEPLPTAETYATLLDGEYIMVYNGLLFGSGTPVDTALQEGTGANTKQKITLTIDKAKTVKKVSRTTGQVEQLQGAQNLTGDFDYSLEIDGGKSELLIIE
ncbi:MAG: hypothetical protein JXR63_03870 [Spirochaetales bacterium]|nr:hypothetical protein [Spirochaetales bacterium]